MAYCGNSKYRSSGTQMAIYPLQALLLASNYRLEAPMAKCAVTQLVSSFKLVNLSKNLAFPSQFSRSSYNTNVKSRLAFFAFFGLALVVALPVAAQFGTPPQKFEPQKFCSSLDNGIVCVCLGEIKLASIASTINTRMRRASKRKDWRLSS